jgi:hypothetical protein
MNWSELAAIAEVAGAFAVLITLVYVAIQLRDTKSAMADQSRIYRANSINSLILASCSDAKLRDAQLTAWGMDEHYRHTISGCGGGSMPLRLPPRTAKNWNTSSAILAVRQACWSTGRTAPSRDP